MPLPHRNNKFRISAAAQQRLKPIVEESADGQSQLVVGYRRPPASRKAHQSLKCNPPKVIARRNAAGVMLPIKEWQAEQDALAEAKKQSETQTPTEPTEP